MEENRIESLLKIEIENIGGRALKFVSPGTAGVPDRIVLLPGGRLYFVELKAPGKVRRPIQNYWDKVLKKLGFESRVIDSKQGVKDFIKEVM